MTGTKLSAELLKAAKTRKQIHNKLNKISEACSIGNFSYDKFKRLADELWLPVSAVEKEIAKLEAEQAEQLQKVRKATKSAVCNDRDYLEGDTKVNLCITQGWLDDFKCSACCGVDTVFEEV